MEDSSGEEAFTRGKAVFILGDDTLKTCSTRRLMPTPWDVCCEDREKVATSTLSVQILMGIDLYFLALSTVSRVLRQVRVKVQGSK